MNMRTVISTLITSAVIFLMLALALFVDVVFSKTEEFNARIIDKIYLKEKSSNERYIKINPDNSSSFSTLDTYDGKSISLVNPKEEVIDKFLFILKNKDSEILSAETKREYYQVRNIGDTVTCKIKIGRFSNNIWAAEVELK